MLGKIAQQLMMEQMKSFLRGEGNVKELAELVSSYAAASGLPSAMKARMERALAASEQVNEELSAQGEAEWEKLCQRVKAHFGIDLGQVIGATQYKASEQPALPADIERARKGWAMADLQGIRAVLTESIGEAAAVAERLGFNVPEEATQETIELAIDYVLRAAQGEVPDDQQELVAMFQSLEMVRMAGTVEMVQKNFAIDEHLRQSNVDHRPEEEEEEAAIQAHLNELIGGILDGAVGDEDEHFLFGGDDDEEEEPAADVRDRVIALQDDAIARLFGRIEALEDELDQLKAQKEPVRPAPKAPATLDQMVEQLADLLLAGR